MNKSVNHPLIDMVGNAVVYARFSTHNQREESIEGQLRICHEYAKQEGLLIVGEYIDRAISGKTDNRPDFQRMIDDAKKKQFAYVIVYKLDRFARNRYDSIFYKHALKQFGVKVVSATEGIGMGDESILLEALLEASAEYYSLELAQKIKRGRHEGATKGSFLGGAIPLGYKLEEHRLVVDETTAPIVRYVFDRYAKGVGKKQIINELFEQGYTKRDGAPFTLSSLNRLYHNRKYIGELVQNGIMVKGGCPAIVDVETFDRVQSKVAEHRRSPAKAKAKVEYMLSGKLFCGYCGEAMTGMSGQGRGGNIFHYYACVGRRKMHECQKQHEKKDFIELYVCEQTVLYILEPARLAEIAKRIIELHNDALSNRRIKELERAIEKCDRDMRRFVDALASIPDTARPALYDKMERVGTAKADMLLDLAKLRVLSRARYTEAEVTGWIRTVCIGDLMDVAFRRRLIDLFVNCVYLFDDKVIIFYNVRDGKQVGQIDSLKVVENFGEADFSLQSRIPLDVDIGGGRRGEIGGSHFNANAPPQGYYTNTCFFKGGFAVMVWL